MQLFQRVLALASHSASTLSAIVLARQEGKSNETYLSIPHRVDVEKVNSHSLLQECAIYVRRVVDAQLNS